MAIRILLAVAVAALGCRGEAEGPKLDLVGDAPAPRPAAPAPQPIDGAELHASSFVVDLIQDLVFRKRRDGWTLLSPEAHTSLDRQIAGGVDLLVVALPGGASSDPRDLEADLAEAEALVAAAGGRAVIARSLSEARAARADGRLPVLLLVEGADALAGKELGPALEALAARGVAILGIVAERRNEFADPASAPADPGGLTARGAELVRACREKGILVDLTHASPAAFWDAIVREDALAAVTHTAARALREHPRNLDDLQILGLARAGGLFGLVFNPDFVRAGDPAAATVDDVVAHLAHARSLGAGGALALGSDFGGIVPPAGLGDVSRLPDLSARLGRDGWSAGELAGFLGENALRVLAAAESGQGAAEASRRTPLRPIPAECDTISGGFAGDPKAACDGYLRAAGPRLEASSAQRIRLRDARFAPDSLELFGEPGTPWQVEAQDLAGKVLVRRIVLLDADGRGALPLPAGRGLARLFVSPTRASALREAVVWGR